MRNAWIGLLTVLLALGLALWLLRDDPNQPQEDSLPGESKIDVAAVARAPTLLTSNHTEHLTPSKGEGKYRIQGVVVDENDAPVADVPLEIWHVPQQARASDDVAKNRNETNSLKKRVERIQSGSARRGDLVAKSKTSAVGRFTRSLEAPGAYFVLATPPAPWASATGVTLINAKGPQSFEITIRLAKGAPLRGHVVNASGTPIAAEVRGVAARSSWTRYTRSGQLDGSFSFGTAPDGAYRFDVTIAPDRSFAGFSASVPLAKPLVLTIPSGAGRIEGHAVDTSGEPVRGVSVSLSMKFPSHPEKTRQLHLYAKSDEQGRFALDSLPAGTIAHVSAGAIGFRVRHMSSSRDDFTDGNVEDGKTAGLTITMSRGASIAGTVTAKETGAPISNVVVKAVRSGRRGRGLSTTTGSNGSYRFDGLRPGDYCVAAAHPDFYMPEFESLVTRKKDASIADLTTTIEDNDDETKIDLVLVRGTTISGKVIDANQSPVGDADVFLCDYGFTGFAGLSIGIHQLHYDVPSTQSSEDGSFTLTGIAPRAKWIAFARKKGYGSTLSKSIAVAREPVSEVTILLTRACRVAGKAIDKTGEPLAGIAVSLSGDTRFIFPGQGCVTDKDGRFAIEDVPVANLSVSSYYERESLVIPLTGMKPGDERNDLILQFGLGGSVKGVVHTSEGDPAATVALTLVQQNVQGSSKSTKTNGNGAFEFRQVPTGTYKLYAQGAQHSGHYLGTIQAPADRLEYKYDPQRFVSIEGSVLGPDGTPVPKCDIQIGVPTSQSNRFRIERTNAEQGRFKTRILARAPLSVAAFNASDAEGNPLDYPRANVSITDLSKPITIRFTQGSSIAGRVVDEKGNGIQGASVIIYVNSSISDVNGYWTLNGLSNTKQSIRVIPPPGYSPPDKVPYALGDRQIVITLQRGVAISGRLIIPKGIRVDGGSLSARWTDASSGIPKLIHGKIRIDGTFRVDGIEPNAVTTLVVKPRSIGPGAKPLAHIQVHDVVAGSTDVEVQVELGVSIRGSVLGPDGTLLKSGQVSLSGIGLSYAMIGTDGAFHIMGIRAGEYQVSVYYNKKMHRDLLTITAPANDIRIRLPATKSE